MKKLLTLTLLYLFFSCSPEDESPIEACPNEMKMFVKESLSLELTRQEWSISRVQSSEGFVTLSLAGSTNGDSLVIRVFNEGLPFDEGIRLQSDGTFATEITVETFFVNTLPIGEFQQMARLKVFKGAEILEAGLESCTLKF